MRPFGVIADDLTGSMDSGLQFLCPGVAVVVHLSPTRASEDTIPVLDTESRQDAAEIAYAKVRKAARRLAGRVIYKKIDSTLRGNVGFELEAIMDELHLERALVSPVFPEYGRTMAEGHLLVGDLPLRQTDFVQDPLCPVTDHVPSLLQRQCRRRVGHVGLDRVRQGVEGLLAETGKRPEEILVVDAALDEHLGVIAAAVARLGLACVSCGSAGLARALPPAFGWEPTRSTPYTPKGSARPVLVLAGSRREATARQIEGALSTIGTSLVEIDPLDLPRSSQRAVVSASQALAKGLHTLVTPVFRPYMPDKEQAVASCLGAVAAALVAADAISGLVLTGGSIAFSVCQALGISTIEIKTELAPGIPCGRVRGGQLDGMHLVTKAGGFGGAGTLVKTIRYLRGDGRDDRS